MTVDFTQADRDDMRGQDWMRSLPVAEHAAIPLAIDAGGHVFQASCRCKWRGPVRRGTSDRGRGRGPVNTQLWREAAADADQHMRLMGARAS